jgi:hypothetical protein
MMESSLVKAEGKPAAAGEQLNGGSVAGENAWISRRGQLGKSHHAHA